MKKKLNLADKLKENKKQVLLFAIFIIGLFFLFSYSTQNSGLEEKVIAGQELEDTKIGIPFSDKELDVKNTSLFLAALVIGLLDGFNPCAMWVLIYLITLVSNLEDKRKMWFIVGTFLMASGILYFIILAGWLNLFAIIGFSKWVMFAIGSFAIWTGMYAIYSFYKSGGQIVCEVGDINSRKKTMNKMKDIVNSPITVASVLATIALAFAINSIEFVCSAGLPAMFTQMLAIADVTILAKYFYISVYTLAFMADDLLIFSLALMAINTDLMHKYSGLSKLVGGVVMIGIGVVLLFFPQLLA